MNGPKDNLEDFFHQSYSDSEVVKNSGDWNVPSDMVWEGIQEGLTEERKLSFAFLKWPWSAIAASYLLLMGGYQFIEKNIEERNLTSSNVMEELVVNNEVSTAETTSTDEFIRPEKIGQAINLIQQTDDKTIAHGLGNMADNRLYSANLDRSDFRKSDLSLPTEKNEIADTKNQLVIKTEVTPELLKIEILQRLAILNLQNIVSLDAKAPKISLSPITTPLKKASNLYISANYSTISENLKQHNVSEESSDLLIANVKESKGNKVGVDIGWSNKKGWAIETGIHYTNLERETVINQEISAKVVQANSNSDGTSNLNVTWNDMNGKNELGLRLLNKGDNPLAFATTLPIQMTQNTQSRFIEVPLLVRKNWKIGRVGLSVKTGVLNRFNVSNSFEDPAIALKDEQFEVLASEFQNNSTIENKKYIPQLIAGIALEYFIQPNLSVYVEPSFSKSIRPIFDFGFVNIHSQNKAVTMGMRYHL